MATMKVYRSGTVEVCDHTRSVEGGVYVYADERRPRGFPSRSHSIYASPALAGVVRWVRGRRWNPGNPDLKVREITVAADALVFNVSAWERASDEIADSAHTGDSSKADAAVADYWASSMTIAEFAASDLDPSGVGTPDPSGLRHLIPERLRPTCAVHRRGRRHPLRSAVTSALTTTTAPFTMTS